MYYKIENKKSAIYKKLHAIRSNEQLIEEENLKTVTEKVGLKFDKIFGNHGQQNTRRVTQYYGFQFLEPSKVDLSIWKKPPFGAYIPNTKTKAGREMKSFLNNGLKAGFFMNIFDALNIDVQGKFQMPYVEICGEIIVMYFGELTPSLNSKNIIEITSVEFNQIREKHLK